MRKYCGPVSNHFISDNPILQQLRDEIEAESEPALLGLTALQPHFR